MGRGAPNSTSHASEPKPHTHDRLPSGTRVPTERTSAATFPHQLRTLPAAVQSPESVAVIKIALRLMG